MNGLLILSWLIPLGAALLSLGRRGRWLPALAALPALLTAWLLPVGAHLDVPWLLLGAHFELDPSGRIFLLFSALLWLFAGSQAALSFPRDSRAGRFRVYFLLAMAGNFWLILAADMVNFYLGFSLMGLAAYGLVVHDAKPASLHAGRIYLAMTLASEAALFAALLLIFRHTGSLSPLPAQLVGLDDWAIGLLIFGLGIKAGLLLLHVWLPLAHPAAPAPASAVLSGCMIKAALLGWLRFLPLGQEALPGWGQLLLLLGAATVVYALLVGLLQTHPKVLLAYSSVSKMGLMSAILGLALLEPALSPALLSALLITAAHHGLAKGALFMGVGVAHAGTARWVLPALAIPALALAAAPFTSGALAKQLLEPPLAQLEDTWAGGLPVFLALTSLGTGLLMARFMMLMSTQASPKTATAIPIALPWLLLLGAILSFPLWTQAELPPLSSSWPLAAAALLVLGMRIWRPAWGTRLSGCVPAGDILVPTLRLSHAAGRRLEQAFVWLSAWLTNRTWSSLTHPSMAKLKPAQIETLLGKWPVAGLSLLLIGGTLYLLLWGAQ
ncbi:MAG: proton-conducting transporter membrane subunit [Gammaproteobacteria bacterium]|nr:proton-conducting transporter membrane subunit [Gammaproteobacteria bacterium]